ncbi:hypothetical protein SPRG_03831 [Saprolegnia parasitica CBS 223.65]|uniref:AB hydrolase-1 domain-containing protein n=1 Tax=Saprolegnia parasitica (strain CBS 223.65) TaxID=695850 RepID=A0A067CL46_SAPPC|nr:hypothetical protein SPRG_03831 [Saprolegnia parasitica CBS 223.65]KDO31213.1 hypothetical protein SPRG_03831 [Saprolegnia parasitica CBS 223.65]|eukprot:XP_012197818.1 hypothetical protein SPRG_03831 [Saprolegnia parasitica CBS 223.65]
MGGVAGTLFVLWVRSGFSSATVAAALTFYPPLSTYTLEKDAATAKEAYPLYNVTHFVAAHARLVAAARVFMVPTRPGNEVPCFVFRYPEAEFTLIFSHGNATDCGAMYSRYIALSRELAVNVVAYDYSGYGAATGRPNEANTYTDITAVFDFCVQHLRYPAHKIILYGQSVGSGPSIYLAAKELKIRGLIVHSGLLSGMRVLTPSRALGCLDTFPNIDRIKRVQCSTLIIHGEDDVEISLSHGKGLYEALPDHCKFEPHWVPHRGHNDIGETRECRAEYIAHLQKYLQHLHAQP